jgi:hypothetical protein
MVTAISITGAKDVGPGNFGNTIEIGTIKIPPPSN